MLVARLNEKKRFIDTLKHDTKVRLHHHSAMPFTSSFVIHPATVQSVTDRRPVVIYPHSGRANSCPRGMSTTSNRSESPFAVGVRRHPRSFCCGLSCGTGAQLGVRSSGCPKAMLLACTNVRPFCATRHFAPDPNREVRPRAREAERPAIARARGLSNLLL